MTAAAVPLVKGVLSIFKLRIGAVLMMTAIAGAAMPMLAPWRLATLATLAGSF
jgi:hypothetical protein